MSKRNGQVERICTNFGLSKENSGVNATMRVTGTAEPRTVKQKKEVFGPQKSSITEGSVMAMKTQNLGKRGGDG